MHQIRFNITKSNKVFVSKHAMQRLYQRCRLYFTKSELNDLDFTIRKEFKNSNIDMNFEYSPFDRNKLDSKHGSGSFITISKRLKIIGHYDSETTVVRITTILFNKV